MSHGLQICSVPLWSLPLVKSIIAQLNTLNERKVKGLMRAYAKGTWLIRSIRQSLLWESDI